MTATQGFENSRFFFSCYTAFFENQVSAPKRAGFAKTALEDICTVISVLAIGASIPDRRGRRHLFFFYHASDRIQSSTSFGLALRREIDDLGGVLRNQVDEPFCDRSLIPVL